MERRDAEASDLSWWFRWSRKTFIQDTDGSSILSILLKLQTFSIPIQGRDIDNGLTRWFTHSQFKICKRVMVNK